MLHNSAPSPIRIGKIRMQLLSFVTLGNYIRLTLSQTCSQPWKKSTERIKPISSYIFTPNTKSRIISLKNTDNSIKTPIKLHTPIPTWRRASQKNTPSSESSSYLSNKCSSTKKPQCKIEIRKCRPAIQSEKEKNNEFKEALQYLEKLGAQLCAFRGPKKEEIEAERKKYINGNQSEHQKDKSKAKASSEVFNSPKLCYRKIHDSSSINQKYMNEAMKSISLKLNEVLEAMATCPIREEKNNNKLSLYKIHESEELSEYFP